VAEVSKATIYDQFESKAQLHAHLLERQTEELLAFVTERAGCA
jgi:AcrR family transcriptional regulator